MPACKVRRSLVLVAAAFTVLVAGPATAGELQPSPEALLEAKVHYEAGKIYYTKEKFRQAITEFEAGYELVKKPAFLLNIAQCYRKLGNNTKAREYYQKYLAEDPSSPSRAQVEKILGEIEADLAKAEEDSGVVSGTPSPEPPSFGATPAPARRSPPPLPAAPPVDTSAASVPQASDEPSAPEPFASSAADEEPDETISDSARSRRAKPVKDEKPFYGKAWFWTLMGLLVVGGAAGAFFATRAPPGYVAEGTLGNIDARRKM